MLDVFWLPLTRELSSEARLRERKSCVFLQPYPFSPSVTVNPFHLSTAVSVGASKLRLEIATGNPHPRQREARIRETPTL